MAWHQKLPSFQARGMNGVKLLLVPSHEEAQQSKVNAVPLSLLGFVPCAPHSPTQHMPAQRVAAPCRTLQRQLSAAEAASMQECKQEKQRIVQKYCEIRMWDFSFSTHLQTGSRVLMALIASSTFPLGFLTVKYEHHIYHQY